MAGSGVDAENIKSELQSINLYQHADSSERSTSEIDIDSYLRSRKEDSIILSIEDSIRSTSLDFDNFINQTVSFDWKTRKEQICQSFGLSSIKNRPTTNDKSTQFNSTSSIIPKWTKGSLGRSVLGTYTTTEDFTDVEAPQLLPGQIVGPKLPVYSQENAHKYISIIQDLNKYRQISKPYPISQQFHEVSKSLGSDIRSVQMQDVWNIIKEITGESLNEFIPERKYAHGYLNSGETSPESSNLRRRIIHGTKRFLEKQFLAQIENNISRNPIEAQLGGVPSVYNKIRAALNLKFSENGKWVHPTLEIVNNVPIWALIYFMIRSGCLKDALEFTIANREAFEKLGSSFPIYLKAYVESPSHTLTNNLLDSIRKEFNEQLRFFDESNSDPYKYALFKIIGRCELLKKTFPGVVETTEDWLWIHFSLISEGSDEISTVFDKYTLKDLQATITKFGPDYFDPERKSPGLYTQVLVMSGLFEKAVYYAYKFSKIDAVHFAIALTYHGLLRPFSQTTKLHTHLLETVSEKDELNFARLVGTFTKEFRRTSSVDAVEYLVLICLNKDLNGDKGKEQLNLCHEALKELVLDTRDFSKILGDIRMDGTRISGAIEQRLSLIALDSLDQYLQVIAEQAATRAEEEGRIADAVLLYQLSEDFDTVITIINKSLGELLSVSQLGQPLTPVSIDGTPLITNTTEDPAQLARHIMTVYRGNIGMFHKVKPKNRDTCAKLLGIVDAWNSFAKGAVEQCLKEVNELNILMLDPSADVGMVRTRAQQFPTLHQSVARNVPTLLVMVMRCCTLICEQLNTSFYHNEGRHAQMIEMQGISRNCMIYAGMIQYKMPHEVFMELTRLEIKI